MPSLYQISAVAIAVAYFVAMTIAQAAGIHFGALSARRSSDRAAGGFSAVSAAVLALLGLLLAFTFSMAATRYEVRRIRLIQETNAAGTVYLRADLVAEPARSAIKEAVRGFVQSRIDFHGAGANVAASAEARASTAAYQDAIWKAVVEECRREPQTVRMTTVIQAANDLFDTAAAHTASYQEHVADTIIWLLFAVAATSALLIGYTDGLTGSRSRLAALAFNCTMMLVVYAILDLDRPRRGLIRIDLAPMTELRDQLSDRIGNG
ncbi:MAG: hypothetical protein U0746_02345 [Gemmataceae bacterium]